MCRRFEILTKTLLKKLPHFKQNETNIIKLNPIYSSLFEIELSSNSNKIKLSEDIFKYDLTNNNIQLYFNIFEETDLDNFINILSKVDKIIVKQHDKFGKVFNNINISIKNIDYNFKISQNYVDNNICTYLIFVLNDIEVRF